MLKSRTAQFLGNRCICKRALFPFIYISCSYTHLVHSGHLLALAGGLLRLGLYLKATFSTEEQASKQGGTEATKQSQQKQKSSQRKQKFSIFYKALDLHMAHLGLIPAT